MTADVPTELTPHSDSLEPRTLTHVLYALHTITWFSGGLFSVIAMVINYLQRDTLQRLAEVIESRRRGDPDKSYVARLFHKGTDAILKKIGEEATETVMAAKDGDRQKIVYEVADLWFHSLIALAHFGLSPADVLAELERREGLSGLEEFAARKADLREQEEG